MNFNRKKQLIEPSLKVIVWKWAIQDSNKKSQLTTNKELSKTANNNKVHDPVHQTVFCPELQQIIDCWDSLPDHIKAAIQALVQSHIQGIQK
ncbi:MAG: hypothetical protein ACYS67_04535 [Planctomycetota bacterium]